MTTYAPIQNSTELNTKLELKMNLNKNTSVQITTLHLFASLCDMIKICCSLYVIKDEIRAKNNII